MPGGDKKGRPKAGRFRLRHSCLQASSQDRSKVVAMAEGRKLAEVSRRRSASSTPNWSPRHLFTRGFASEIDLLEHCWQMMRLVGTLGPAHRCLQGRHFLSPAARSQYRRQLASKQQVGSQVGVRGVKVGASTALALSATDYAGSRPPLPGAHHSMFLHPGAGWRHGIALDFISRSSRSSNSRWPACPSHRGRRFWR